MNTNSSNSLVLMIGLFVALIIVTTGWQVSQAIAGVAQSQAIALDNLGTWKAAYQALLPVKDKWDTTFQVGVGSNEQDLVRIFNSLRLRESGLDADDSQIRGEKVEAVTYNNIGVGLVRTCVGGEGDGVKVYANSMSGMIRGMERMVRPDIEVGSISTQLDKNGRPMAMLGGLCVLVRGEH